MLNYFMHTHNIRYFCNPQNHQTSKAQFPLDCGCTSNSSHTVINQMSSHITLSSPTLPTLPLPTLSLQILFLLNVWDTEHTLLLFATVKLNRANQLSLLLPHPCSFLSTKVPGFKRPVPLSGATKVARGWAGRARGQWTNSKPNETTPKIKFSSVLR